MAMYESEHTKFMREWMAKHPEQREEQKKGRAQQKAENHGYKTKAAHVSGHFHGWLQKAEKSRAKHHAACRAKKTVHGLTRKFAAGENEGGPQGY